jgi:hypothetical protein
LRTNPPSSSRIRRPTISRSPTPRDHAKRSSRWVRRWHQDARSTSSSSTRSATSAGTTIGGLSRVGIERSHAPGRAEGGEDRRSAGPHLRTSLA